MVALPHANDTTTPGDVSGNATASSGELIEGTIFTSGFDGIAVEMKGYFTMAGFKNASVGPYQICVDGEESA